MNRQFAFRAAIGVAAALVSSTVARAGRARGNRDHRDAHSGAAGRPRRARHRHLARDIERSLATDVSELLHGQAGLEISRNGGPGQTTTLFTRGTDSNHTVVLVDGVRINPGTIGGAALQNIAPESIERIEIVKGPRSSLYGTDAIGGVIQLFTRGAAQEGFSAGATYGSDCHAAAVRRWRLRPRRPAAHRLRRQLRRERRHAGVRRQHQRSRLSQCHRPR